MSTITSSKTAIAAVARIYAKGIVDVLAFVFNILPLRPIVRILITAYLLTRTAWFLLGDAVPLTQTVLGSALVLAAAHDTPVPPRGTADDSPAFRRWVRAGSQPAILRLGDPRMVPPEITKAQLQQSVETYRVQLSLLVQICTVLVLADATTVGYSIQQRLAGLLWVGAVFPVVMIMCARVVGRMSVPVLATAITIEAKYNDPEVGGLISTFVAVAISPGFAERLTAAAMLDDRSSRAKALSALGARDLFVGARPVRHVLRLIIIGQAIRPNSSLALLRLASLRQVVISRL
ncbi:MAG TPA: hypothetical protein VII95_08570 [Terriglobales bacterium]